MQVLVALESCDDLHESPSATPCSLLTTTSMDMDLHDHPPTQSQQADSDSVLQDSSALEDAGKATHTLACRLDPSFKLLFRQSLAKT